MGDCPRGLKTGLRLTGINSTDSVIVHGAHVESHWCGDDDGMAI